MQMPGSTPHPITPAGPFPAGPWVLKLFARDGHLMTRVMVLKESPHLSLIFPPRKLLKVHL